MSPLLVEKGHLWGPPRNATFQTPLFSVLQYILIPRMFSSLYYTKKNLSSAAWPGVLWRKSLHLPQDTAEHFWEAAELWQARGARGRCPKRGHLSRWNFALTWSWCSCLSLQTPQLLQFSQFQKKGSLGETVMLEQMW